MILAMAAQRVTPPPLRRLILCLALLTVALVAPPARASADALTLRGLHFVASEGSHNTLVLRADVAHINPARARAKLQAVHARLGANAPGAQPSSRAPAVGGLEFHCAHGEFDFETRNISATGAVRGATHDGRRFETERLRYDAARARIAGDAPIVVYESAGVFEGTGFEYFIAEDKFLLRDARLRGRAP